MKKCPHCHTSMLLEHSSTWGDPELVWKCLGCGRETFYDAARQAEDERLQQGIVVARRQELA